MQIHTLMSKMVHCCGPEDSLKQAAQLMWDHDCGSLPVCTASDGAKHAIGVITDRDICMCALFQDQRLSELRVQDAMAAKLLSCRPTDSVEHAESLMRQAKVRRLPVVDERGSLAGVISLADLARAAPDGNPAQQVGSTLAVICTPQQQRLSA